MARDPASRAANPTQDAEAGNRQPNVSAEEDRSGQDERKRGWFWHWNGIVTQYAPLLGLKGIGLLNSYTVWTDRREDSPHRGYAFPSQQSEANFYGEDRAELITINKILVALDLIEIRKEMVRKVDEKGRRWKVPQNLYRVKDRPEGIDLTTADVIRVAELAAKDKAVYRYIRKVFSSRFEPIDRNNVWHQILVEVADDPNWLKLSARAAKQEARASARTKAGHKSRARSNDTNQGAHTTPERDRDHASEGRSIMKMTSGHISESVSVNTERSSLRGDAAPTTADLANGGSDATDDKSNNGSGEPDDLTNNGSPTSEGGSVASTSNGYKSSVEPGNTMYYESSTTTTTTTSDTSDDSQSTDLAGHRVEDDRFDQKIVPPDGSGRQDQAGVSSESDRRDLNSGDARSGQQSPQRRMAGAPGAGPVGDPSPLVVSLYEAANDRSATSLERILLSELETDASAPAEAAGSTGPKWIAEALREAVGSGSSFVAPKRIREIVNRWASSGSGPRGNTPPSGAQSSANRQAGPPVTSSSGDVKQARDTSREGKSLCLDSGEARQGERLWGVVLDMLAAGDGGPDLVRLRGVIPAGERADGVFLLGAPTRVAARMIDGPYRQPIEQALSTLFSSSVSVAALNPSLWSIKDES